MNRRWRSGLRMLLGSYLGFCLLISLVQRSLIYQPSRFNTLQAQAAAAAHRFLPWTNSAGVRLAWWRPAQPTGLSPRGVVLLTHGNAGSAVDRNYLVDPLQAGWPVDVVLLEYPGYADRPGKPTQATLVAAAEELFTQIKQHWGPRPVYLVGESLGSGVASYLAGRQAEVVKGTLLMVPFDKMTSVAASHYPWLPVGWLLWDPYPSDRWLQTYAGPLGILVGEQDQIIPPVLGRRLYEGFSGTKRLWTVPAGHNETCQQSADWWRELGSYLETSR